MVIQIATCPLRRSDHRNSQSMAARAGLSLLAIAFPVLALGFVILAAVVGLNIAAPKTMTFFTLLPSPELSI
jgi:hypothetical protein